jgi:hypothetical protein
MTAQINRRKALTIVAAVPAAVALAAVPVLAGEDAAARVEHHTRELEKAMRDLYGREVEVLRFEPTDGMVACVMVAANGGGNAHPRKNSRWLFAGQEDWRIS